MTQEAREFLARIFRFATRQPKPPVNVERTPETRSGGTGRPPEPPPGP